MSDSTFKTVKADANGCVTLGSFAKEGDRFKISMDDNLRIILEPLNDISENERWIYSNPEIYEELKQGMKQSQNGETKSLGTFTQYAEE